MVPEDIEDLISETHSAVVADTITSCFFVSLSLIFVSEPKVDQIDQRLGPLVQQFKDLVYPADYNPDSKPSAKRKTGQSYRNYSTVCNCCSRSVDRVSSVNQFVAADGGGAEKKPKAEVSEDVLRVHVQNGTLEKLTVPVLKEACKQFGLQTTGTKKKELIDALMARLGP